MHVGILTGGGDCPGLNAVIRAAAKRFYRDHDARLLGIRKGWQGMIYGAAEELTLQKVSGILPKGGTILGTSRTNPRREPGGIERIEANFREWSLDGLIAVGGEDTLGVAADLRGAGSARGRCPEDHRQRSFRHRRHLRLRHRGQHRHRSHRSPAHHRRSPRSRHRGRGDGTPHRLDRGAAPASPVAPT